MDTWVERGPGLGGNGPCQRWSSRAKEEEEPPERDRAQ